MSTIKNILSELNHRPFEIPKGNWTYYQEWNKALFLHWKIPYEVLRALVPKHLILDTFQGDCYISLVAFTMQKIRPSYLPAVKFISDFDEINLRTYINNDDKQGVYFLNIEAGKALSVFIAKALSGLPYETSVISRNQNKYQSTNRLKDFYLEANFTVEEKIHQKTELDKWLTERYCLYLEKKNKIYRYDIHHKEWEINKVQINQLKLKYKVGSLDLSDQQPDLLHYSEGVKVLAWKMQKLG